MAEEVYCPKCNSGDTYYSKKKAMYVCEDCDNVFQPTLPKKQKVFFSYGHDENAIIVERLKNSLEIYNYDIWIDKSEIKEGKHWRNAITEGIISSSAMVAFLSKHSVRSPGVCLDEISIGLSHIKGNIQTVLLENEQDVSVPSSISDIQWHDMSEWRDYIDEPNEWDSWYNSKLTTLRDILEDPLNKNFQGEIRQIQGLLRPIESDSREKMLLSKPFVGRKWLSQQLEDWRINNSESRAYIIYAPPGIGKSSFSANQLHYNHSIICGVFCEWNKPDYNNPINIIKLISFKLATRLPDYRSLLLKRISDITVERLLSLSPVDLFDQLLSQPLSEMIDGNRERMLVVVDGIDETANRGECNILAEALSANISKLPRWLALVITCRPESNITPLFKQHNPVPIEAADSNNMNDIEKYLDDRISELSDAAPDISNLRQGILDKCQGSFLYVSLLVENIKSRGSDTLSIDNIPDGLQAFYYDDFSRIFKLPEQYAEIQGLLELLVTFQEMPKSMLHKILDIKYTDMLHQIEKLGSLLNLVKSDSTLYESEVYSYRFCHKSIVDWLTDYEASCRFYVDINQGLEKALIYFENNFKPDVICEQNTKLQTDDVIEQHYLQTHIIDCYIKLSQWDRLEAFLLNEKTPLYPYWQALCNFPEHHSTVTMINYLESHNDNLSFFTRLQRSGEQTLCASIIGKMVKQNGIGSLTIDVFSIYADIVHIGGEYIKAVELYDNYLAAHKSEDVYKDTKLLYIAIRRIHHSMFFSPAEDLIKEALLLTDYADSSTPDIYNELVFLIGGNLGILSGDIPFAELWLKKSLDFAQKNDNYDFEVRTIRKIADIHCYNREYNEALKLTQRYFQYDDELHGKSRYHIYLLGLLGEIYRHLKDFEKSEKCYSRLLDITDKQGLGGWKCHALLGYALLSLSEGYFSHADEYLNRASNGYEHLKMSWGIISSKIVSFLLSLRKGNSYSEMLADIDYWKQEAKKLQYRYNESILNELARDGTAPDFHLFYL